MSKLSQMIFILNADKMLTGKEFEFYCDCLDKSMHDYAKIRKIYRENIEKPPMNIAPTNLD